MPGAIRSAKLVKLSELAAALPAGMQMVTQGERKEQVAVREANWARSLR